MGYEVDSKPWVPYRCSWCGNPAALKVDTNESLSCPVCGKKELGKILPKQIAPVAVTTVTHVHPEQSPAIKAALAVPSPKEKAAQIKPSKSAKGVTTKGKPRKYKKADFSTYKTCRYCGKKMDPRGIIPHEPACGRKHNYQLYVAIVSTPPAEYGHNIAETIYATCKANKNEREVREHNSAFKG